MLVLLILGSMPACDSEPTGPIASQITIFGGDHQVAEAGSWIPLSVRVTDGHNRGVPNVRVYWQVTAGAGEFTGSLQAQPRIEQFTVTNADGVAHVFVRFTVVGTSTVAASVTGLESSPVTFTTTVAKPADMVIEFGPVFDCTVNDPSQFIVSGTDGSDVSVPVGATVEWVYMESLHPACRAQITSTSWPDGGEPFDSGIMSPGQRFRFVPGVVGTWDYADALNGGDGALTATR